MTLLSLWQITVILLLASTVIFLFTKLRHARGLVMDKQRKGLPVAPNHSFLFGHLLYLKSAVGKLPPNAHYQNALGDIAREYFPHTGLYYLDTWPVSGILLINVSPHVANQIHGNPGLSMERPELLPRFFKPICGGPSLFDLREKDWKPWRAIFSKGFSTDYILSLVPGMVDETVVYCNMLQNLAIQQELFCLDLKTLRYTIDVIGKTILNTHLGAQQGYNTLADCMMSQIRWHQANADINPLVYFNLVRRVVHWWNGRQMDHYIGNELDKRYDEYKADPENKRTKAIIDLVLQAYLPNSTQSMPERLDAEFRAFAISQIRLFVFVGHDSTSSTICYIVYLLAKNPQALARIRGEHDELLGTDLIALPTLLKQQPHLTNSLPYTTAVIKETLRLFPPGGCSRAGKPHIDLIDDQGHSCPTEHAVIFTIHSEMHRAPAYWTRADEFLPERWLVEPGHELYPMKGAYRAFEVGPRNCFAQGYAMTGLRVLLACMVRRYDFTPAYDEWDRMHPSTGPRTYRGERAYQVEEGAAHPVNHFPCRVSSVREK